MMACPRLRPQFATNESAALMQLRLLYVMQAKYCHVKRHSSSARRDSYHRWSSRWRDGIRGPSGVLSVWW